MYHANTMMFTNATWGTDWYSLTYHHTY